MEERRRKMLALPEQERWVAFLKELDFIERRIGDKCEERISSVSGLISENTKISQAALDGIKALADALSITIAVEGTGKAAVINGSKISKLLLPIIAFCGAVWALIMHGKWPS